MVFIPFCGAFVTSRGSRNVTESAFIGIMGMEWAGYPATYAMLAVATLAAIVWFILRRATPPPAHA